MNTNKSNQLFERAKNVFPGGVNSPIRAFRSVGGTPIVFERGEGAYLFDVDGNKYVDFVQSWGPLILGHANKDVIESIYATAKNSTSFGAPTKLEIDLAELIISQFPSMDLMRFVSSGTEACMSAVRLARGFTGRDKIIKFSGCYHGHSDSLLNKSAGVTNSTKQDLIVLPFNDLTALQDTFEKFSHQIAAVIVEPIAANMGVVGPAKGFLEGIQSLSKTHGTVFILDEVITGFRASASGAQQLFGLDPDITCLGKVIGGGTPVGAFGGKRHIMQHLAPLGNVFQAGTLSGNPLAMAAGYRTIKTFLENNLHNEIQVKTSRLVAGIEELAKVNDINIQTAQFGSIFGLFFLNNNAPNNPAQITDYESVEQYVDTKRYAKFFHHMLSLGFYFAPSPEEAGFISAAHSDDDIRRTLNAIRDFFIKC